MHMFELKKKKKQETELKFLRSPEALYYDPSPNFTEAKKLRLLEGRAYMAVQKSAQKSLIYMGWAHITS